ncbi:MAG: hypothetical protein MI867_29540 [Pseudomonadales bacterium]|nr:hypothetical protein [Pseudomonadales bacterium]
MTSDSSNTPDSSEKSKEELYLDIAKACLAAINQHANESPQKAYEKVYTAIDEAMQAQYGPMIKAHEKGQRALEAIAQLAPEDFDKAPDIAQAALQGTH